MITFLSLLMTGDATADPCGMVPPITTNVDMPGIQRDGIQRTYVMHSRGVETMILRPGFVGDVEEFGMLIPFPSPPAIRKIEDDTFQHIEAALAPPEVQVQIVPRPRPSSRSRSGGMVMAEKSESMSEGALELERDEVRVLSEEAVGMYQVAVLEAGSPKALEKWMSENGYRYPEGMDAVTLDYVNAKWCFVAIKAAVGQASGVTPEPGMRSADPTRPPGTSFSGHVQGMGFRFASEDFVIPMRLSVFNGEDPHNVVYALSDDPLRIDDVPTDLVALQVPGTRLHGTLTQPLKVNYAGGSANDLQDHEMQQVQAQRDPTAWMGQARDLFAADLLAVRTGQLNLPFEEEEKELLRISEAFGMRGANADSLHNVEISAQRGEAVDGALDDLKEMRLTVVDGVLPGEVLARQNLILSRWVLPEDARGERSDPLQPPDINMTFWR